MARPKNTYKTVAKTYSYLEEDIAELLELKVSARQILKLGLQAYKSGWNAKEETGEVVELKERIKGLSYTLQLYVEKFNKLAKVVEKRLEIDLSEDVVNNKKLDELLEDIEE